MGTQRIPAPGADDVKFVDAYTAAAWLCVSDDTFVRLIEDYPWVRKKRVRGRVVYSAADVAVLGYLIDRTDGTAEESEKK